MGMCLLPDNYDYDYNYDNEFMINKFLKPSLSSVRGSNGKMIINYIPTTHLVIHK